MTVSRTPGHVFVTRGDLTALACDGWLVRDLLIAAAAESAGVPVLHCDADFDRIAAITGQPTRWALPGRS